MNINEVQCSLWEQSKAQMANRDWSIPLLPINPYDKRVRKLMDLMHNPTWIRAAAERVLTRSKGKKAGVDKVTVAQFREQYEKNLETLRLELKRGTYRPQPVRQALIPKANGQMRELGIPCLRDKIVQEAIRMALEPIFEAEFHDNSYGFRPNRNAHHAVFRCQQLMKHGFTWVIEGDVKACFNEISHKAILKVVREKVMDNKFLALIELFLKAGVRIKKETIPTEKGVPQGGIISPLLANAVLNKLDWFLHSKGEHGAKGLKHSWYNGLVNIRFTRYADDWCVFITRGTKEIAENLRNEIEQFLKRECGLRLSQEKTLITHVRDGFDFLGFHLLCSTGKKGNIVPKIKISQNSIRNYKERILDATRRLNRHISISARIYRATHVVRGWGEYFRIAQNYSKVAGDMDHYTFWTMVKAICRMMDIPTGKCLKRHYHKKTIHYKKEIYLGKLREKSMKLDYHKPIPYHPSGKNGYENELEMEENALRFGEGKRPGSTDIKLEILQRDEHRCKKCGKEVDAKNSNLDHIKPVKHFPNVKAASTPDNLQTLCLECHKAKGDNTGKKRRKFPK